MKRQSDPGESGIKAMIGSDYRDPAPTYDRWNDACQHIFQTKNDTTPAQLGTLVKILSGVLARFTLLYFYNT